MPTTKTMTTDQFVTDTRAWVETFPEDARRVLAIAGAPGSGKSTLAETLTAALNASSPGVAAILPMDGYHYDDEVLVPRGHRPRKGAPHTFDIGGYAAMLARLRANLEDEIAVPRFDRTLEIARAGARIIPRAVRLIVTEGNYLLLDRPNWTALREQFDRTALLDVPEDELARRLHARWDGYGMEAEAIRAKLEENDLPNARTVIAESVDPDIRVVP